MVEEQLRYGRQVIAHRLIVVVQGGIVKGEAGIVTVMQPLRVSKIDYTLISKGLMGNGAMIKIVQNISLGPVFI